jgi:nicotinamide phosphoribosyltransferase
MNTLAPLLIDGYKVDHRRQYPANSELVFSNLTARGTRVKRVNKVISFGLQYFMKKYLLDAWERTFFSRPLDEVTKKYGRRLLNYLGVNNIGDQHIRDLHALGYLPLEIWALPEGSNVNLRVPMFVVFNTDARFFWLTNAIETILSCSTWGCSTSATTALIYRKIFNEWAEKTNPEMIGFVPFQGHDFSFRGMMGLEAATMSGAAHLLSFVGTDTLPAIDFLEEYYNADSDKEMVGVSVAATEHSVMSLGGMKDEVETFRRLIEDIYPDNIVSIVSDTWDFWNVVNPDGGICARLKSKIMARNGKVVIRPDSGDPVKIVTGYTFKEVENISWPPTFTDECERLICKGEVYEYDVKQSNERQGPVWVPSKTTILEVKGMIQCLWEIFGGTITSTGYKQLDSHIGAIYGDSITIGRAEEICERLAAKGFASTNLVYGIGSFTYQGAITMDAIVTRDTHGFAVKSTYGEVTVDGKTKGVEIFKDPKTDDGLKKSAKGLIAVYEKDGEFVMKDQATWEEVKNCAFEQVFKDGVITKEQTLSGIRELVAKNF